MAAWHAGLPASGGVLRVVYFHPSDRDPLPDDAERLYYGGGTRGGGLCHGADCELLDPLLLTAKDRKIVYPEHYFPRMELMVSKFNRMYLVGTAHGLGHGLGLPHDAGSAREQWIGTSLMGSGNLTYRQEVWGGGRPVYLQQASALQLMAHPLVTGSNKGRWTKPEGRSMR